MKRIPLVFWSLVLAALILANTGNTSLATAQGTAQPIPVDQLTMTALDPLSIPNGGLFLDYTKTPVFLSPDSKLIAWVSDNNICIYSATGEKQNCGTLKQAIDPNSVRWSADSTRIAFTEYYFRYFLESDIWVMDAATGKTTDLTDDHIDDLKQADIGSATGSAKSIDVVPIWSSDGTRLIFERSNGYNPPGLYSIDANGGEAKQEGTFNVNGPLVYALAMSPDGSQIAYNMDYGPTNPKSGLWIANLDGSSPRQLYKGADDSADELKVRTPSDIQFSADGKYVLAYNSKIMDMYRTAKAVTTSRVVAADGSGDFPVNADNNAEFATWGPDGATLIYIVRDPKNPDEEGLYAVAKPGDKGHQIYKGLITSPAQSWRTLFLATNNTLIVQPTGPDAGTPSFALMHLGMK